LVAFCAIAAVATASNAQNEEPSRAGDILHFKMLALEAQRIAPIIESVEALAEIDEEDARDAIGVILNDRCRSGEFIPADRIIEASRGVTPHEGSGLWRTLEWVRDRGGHWRDRVVSAEMLAIAGDQASIAFLIAAYGEPRVLLPAEEVRQLVGEALAKVDDPQAGLLLAQHARTCDPNHLLRRLLLMLRHDNAQAVVVGRRVLAGGESLELDLLTRLITVFERWGDKEDLDLWRPLMEANAAEPLFIEEDGERVTEALQRLEQRLEEQE